VIITKLQVAPVELVVSSESSRAKWNLSLSRYHASASCCRCDRSRLIISLSNHLGLRRYSVPG